MAAPPTPAASGHPAARSVTFPARIAPATLKDWLHDGAEIALCDVREAGQFGEAHLLYAVPLPYSRLELDAPRLLPNRQVRLVLCDDGNGSSGGTGSVADRAAERLAALGYRPYVLDGGTAAWAAAGFALFAGVNVPSKTFGELVEHRCHTPRVTPQQLAAWRAEGRDLVVVDGRPFAEYRKMNIPGAVCCPNGELALRIDALTPRPDTTIVVNCAGRTRSLIGAQTLIDLGLPNPVYALENGTQGWVLADLTLEHGSARRYPDDAHPADPEARRYAARRLARRWGVGSASAARVSEFLADTSRSTYLCDVRAPEEFQAGSLPGAQSTPGGQLIQATDQFIAVRRARLVLVDDDGIRAPVVGSWLARLGYEVWVLAGGLADQENLHACTGRSNGYPPGGTVALPAAPPPIGAAELAERLARGDLCVIDVRPGMTYRQGHIPGSTWALRPRLADLALAGQNVVLVADDPAIAALAGDEARRLGAATVALLDGGLTAWKATGGRVETTPDDPADSACIDYLFFVHDRHDGNREAARRYLAWETGLVAQLDARERAELDSLAPSSNRE
ncbi:hypothetical protein OTERR_30450 [Oryzomicrobium terrae]|uniref:Rhodanese domain-containing protein n=1 Tax=Oryzomicrobium terrae TaxID=1735038 RepID=A0A5C1EC28_9RHOO|nr:rhodanese-like domain-containing protein [Oryzomicrobium terrae]QEL66521.1 hypothetical protein OTERR_30450 [Oryzomicrobium terrae]